MLDIRNLIFLVELLLVIPEASDFLEAIDLLLVDIPPEKSSSLLLLMFLKLLFLPLALPFFFFGVRYGIFTILVLLGKHQTLLSRHEDAQALIAGLP